MYKFIAKLSAIFVLKHLHDSYAQPQANADSDLKFDTCLEASDAFIPEYMPDLMNISISDTSEDNITASAENPYITKQVTCALTPTAQANIGQVEFISIDSFPDSFKYLRDIRYNITIPSGSGVENRYCNPHCDETMGGALGVNDQGVPSFKGIKVNFDPGILCTGAGYEPFLVASIKQAINIATANAALGKITITTYSIGGTYNTLEKIYAMRNLTEVPGSFVVTVIGNNLGQYDNCANKFLSSIPKLFIIGGTQNGDQLSRYTMVGGCVKFYAPARYISPVTQQLNEGVSFAGPIVGFLIANYKLNHPEATREQIDQHLLSLTDVVTRTTAQGVSVNMHIFRKDKACNVGTLPPAPTPPPTPVPTPGPSPTPCEPDTFTYPNFVANNNFKWFTNTLPDCQDFCVTVEVYKNKANTQATLGFRNPNNKVTSTLLAPTKLQTLYVFNARREAGTNLLQINGTQPNQTKSIILNGRIKQFGFKGDRVAFKNIHSC